ncbi:hypothetical protein HYV83_05780 [Candidatus Woesearchaeota archaeon]|nr:hypothetical protein [Candidatus Woesearchaeota archaeon]
MPGRNGRRRNGSLAVLSGADGANYHITSGHIRKLDYHEQFLVWYGLNQLTIPDQIWAKLNPAESLGITLATQIAKQENMPLYVNSQQARIDERACQDDERTLAEMRANAFRETVNSLIAVGYDHPGILKAHRMKGNPHPTKPGDLQSRIDSIVNSQRDAVADFLESFRWPRMLSQAESEALGSFNDPGAGMETGKNVYVVPIMNKITERYREANIALEPVQALVFGNS